jgi:fructose-bisphosphate aldolase class II
LALVKVADIYHRARESGYGVGGFCINDPGMAIAILQAAEETHSPVVTVIAQGSIRSVGTGYLEAMVKHGASQVDIPVAIMLDHGTDLAICLQCIMNGHSSVMFDGSHHPFEENMRLTRQVCELAHLLDVTVEGELGTIPHLWETSGEWAGEPVLVDPEIVPRFVKETGLDALAIALGNASGIPKEPPKLDFERLKKVTVSTDAYLVIHGGSGTPKEDVRRAIALGATAFRFASENYVAYLNAVEAARAQFPPGYPDTKVFYGLARDAAKKLISERMEHLGCAGKAW